jgi:hypothetical protein
VPIEPIAKCPGPNWCRRIIIVMPERAAPPTVANLFVPVMMRPFLNWKVLVDRDYALEVRLWSETGACVFVFQESAAPASPSGRNEIQRTMSQP